jgi:hypothetical protein
LCITLTCPYRRACPCLNPIHDHFLRYTRGILQQVGRCSESSRACHYMIYLSERSGVARASAALGAMQEKQREEPFRRECAGPLPSHFAEWRESWAQIQRPRPICSQPPGSHIFFSFARLHRNSVVEKEQKHRRIARDNWIQIDCA